jgi:ceramide glucosyltransferase
VLIGAQISLAVLSVLALVFGVLLTIQCWECRRFVRGRLSNTARATRRRRRRVTLFAPCKGADLELEQNLQSLFQQDYDNYEVVFIVESEDDEAAATIRRVMDQNRNIPSRLVIAGRATESGQKVHNLRVATERLAANVEVLAFVDSDARPGPTWLSTMVAHLHDPGVGATTGYRWFVPQRQTPANLILYCINSAVAGLMGPHAYNLVWGGSWAIRREVFDTIALRAKWTGTLSDDLVASRVLNAAGLRIEFEPCCMAASPVDVTLAGMFEFTRRQYLIGRRYAPPRWRLALLAASLMQAAMWSCLIAALYGAATGSMFWWLPAIGFAALYALGIVRAWFRQDVGRRLCSAYAQRLAPASRFDIFAGPLVGIINWLGIVSALFGSCITWRGNRYRILPGGQIRLLSRKDESTTASAEQLAVSTAATHTPRSRTTRALLASNRNS